ncbi:MAG TPA: precorrin-6A reductase [Armatimonadota bacterium]|jgi:precorrin-6A/cobalt-precorrin-6A reductase
MILVLGGTSEARTVAKALKASGQRVLLTAVHDYAGELVSGAVEVRIGALDEETLGELVRDASLVVDATHPFATAITEMAIAVCAQLNVPYVRFERPKSTLPDHVFLAEEPKEAARLAVAKAQGGTIFLTVGSKTLSTYLETARAAQCRLVARVLPVVESLNECTQLGMQPRDIVAMQGPTSAELDAALLCHFAARVLVTKESGTTGGVEEKIEAAEMVGIPVIVVCRPNMVYPRAVRSVDELFSQL